jgi:hypothetical protein
LLVFGGHFKQGVRRYMGVNNQHMVVRPSNLSLSRVSAFTTTDCQLL